jgi:3,4-dihydroxy 2-butanone 4-phosphate synthase/GTP cyclohydrolase II
MSMAGITEALHALQQGTMIVVVDDENRENEGDLICSARMITAEQINFMARFGRGLICVALPSEQVERLDLPLMVRNVGETDAFGTAFTYSVDAKDGITTGISAHDRALTIRLAADPTSCRDQLVVPGHVFPLKAKNGGVLERRGHTEAAVDVTRLAGLVPGGVICEILNDDGTMMRLPDLKKFAVHHNLPIISIDELVKYRITTEIQNICTTVLPTPWGLFHQSIYHDVEGKEHVLMSLGSFSADDIPLVRIHSECLTGDVFESLRCDCGAQLRKSLSLIGKEGAGILIYLRQEGRGIGLTEKIKSYALQDKGLDTVEANHALGHATDTRRYEVAIKMLQDLHVTTVRLLTNNPSKIDYLKKHTINVIHVPLLIEVNQYNERYQFSKAVKLGHHIPFFEQL